MFIDIHNHSLFGVDDGAKTLKDSLELLADAKEQGAEAMILTPHYRHGMFRYPTERIQEHFKELKEAAEGLGLDLYLGCEYHVNSEVVEAFNSGRCETLAGGDYVLTEYSFQTEYSYILENTQKLLSCGYFPVIAHVERYKCFQKKPSLCAEISNVGALIQINAESVLGKAGWTMSHFCKKLLKNEWADVIASDTHDMQERACHMGQCRELVEKKYGVEYADLLFVTNPKRIIHNK